MPSIRLHPELEKRLERAASIRGESLADFIRLAAVERAEATFLPVNAGDFADVVGVVHGGGDGRSGGGRRAGVDREDSVEARSSTA